MNDYMRSVVDRAFEPVSKVKDYNREGKPVYNIVDKFGRKVSTVSERYELVDNRRLVEPFVNRFGLPDKVIDYANRKSFIFEFFTGRNFDLGEGDIIKEKLVIANSYDKTKSFSFFFGAFRTVCTNGLYTAMGAVIAFKKKHVGDIPVDDLVNAALRGYDQNTFPFWKRLKETPLSIEQELGLLSSWVPFEFKKEDIEEKRRYGYNTVEASNNRIKNYAASLVSRDESINNQRNAWGLFNQMNYAVKREFPTAKQVVKRIQGDKRSELYLAESLRLS